MLGHAGHGIPTPATLAVPPSASSAFFIPSYTHHLHLHGFASDLSRHPVSVSMTWDDETWWVIHCTIMTSGPHNSDSLPASHPGPYVLSSCCSPSFCICMSRSMFLRALGLRFTPCFSGDTMPAVSWITGSHQGPLTRGSLGGGAPFLFFLPLLAHALSWKACVFRVLGRRVCRRAWY